MAFVQRTSIHGRRLGLSTTGGIISASTGSTASADQSAQMWGSGMVETLSTVGTISNSGVSIISSDTTGDVWNIAAPVAGVHKEIHFQSPSTEVFTFDTTAVSIFFNSSLGEGSTFGSTTLTAVSPATAGIGGSLVLRGLSATVWGIVSNNVGASS
jgi:hypothetical protein